MCVSEDTLGDYTVVKVRIRVRTRQLVLIIRVMVSLQGTNQVAELSPV